MSAADGDPSAPWLGLGLDQGTVLLREARPEWGGLARGLADAIREALGERAAEVEHIGSTAVPGLAAKPIIDLAAGVARPSVAAVRGPLEKLGYRYRGDAGDQGGLLFVLEVRPRHRVAHVHVVDPDGPQWQRYLAFRDLLRSDASARAKYTRLKRELARRHPHDRRAYTEGKERLVRELLERSRRP